LIFQQTLRGTAALHLHAILTKNSGNEELIKAIAANVMEEHHGRLIDLHAFEKNTDEGNAAVFLNVLINQKLEEAREQMAEDDE
jgi:hypothetical protein